MTEEKKVEKVKQYLLGNISKEESEEIDIAVISDDSLTESFLIAENEIIEDFLEKTLSEREMELFRKNFLTTPKRKQKVLHIAKLKTYAKNSAKEIAKEANASFQNTNKINTRQLFRFLVPVFAVVIICLVAGVIWIKYFKTITPLTPLEAEYAQLNKDVFDNPEKYNTLFPLNLKTTIKRGSDKKSSFVEVYLTDKVLVTLELPSGTNQESTYKIELIRDQNTAFKLNELRVYKNPDGEELKFLLPKEVLGKGSYTVKATNNLDASQITYSFLIE